MPSIKTGQVQISPQISSEARKLLKSLSVKLGISMGEVIDTAIANARNSFDINDIKIPKRTESQSFIIQEKNKKWLKEFSKKTNVKMAPLIEKMIKSLS